MLCRRRASPPDLRPGGSCGAKRGSQAVLQLLRREFARPKGTEDRRSCWGPLQFLKLCQPCHLENASVKGMLTRCLSSWEGRFHCQSLTNISLALGLAHLRQERPRAFSMELHQWGGRLDRFGLASLETGSPRFGLQRPEIVHGNLDMTANAWRVN